MSGSAPARASSAATSPPEGETTTDLAEHAARRAMEAAGWAPTDIDLICVGTTTPDLVFPNVGTLLQDRLGITRLPGIQPGGGLHRLHVRAWRRRQVRAPGRGEMRAGRRRRDADAHHRLERPRHLRAVRRWRRRGDPQARGRARDHQHPPALGRPLQGSAVYPDGVSKGFELVRKGNSRRADEGQRGLQGRRQYPRAAGHRDSERQ